MPHLETDIQPSKVKSVSVYNVGDYGNDLFLPFTDVGLTETSITFSTATLTRDTEDSNQPIVIINKFQTVAGYSGNKYNVTEKDGNLFLNL